MQVVVKSVKARCEAPMLDRRQVRVVAAAAWCMEKEKEAWWCALGPVARMPARL